MTLFSTIGSTVSSVIPTALTCAKVVGVLGALGCIFTYCHSDTSKFSNTQAGDTRIPGDLVEEITEVVDDTRSEGAPDIEDSGDENTLTILVGLGKGGDFMSTCRAFGNWVLSRDAPEAIQQSLHALFEKDKAKIFRNGTYNKESIIRTVRSLGSSVVPEGTTIVAKPFASVKPLAEINTVFMEMKNTRGKPV